MRQVITISPEGQMSGLQRKPGQGIDLTQLGRAQVERASEVFWSESAQAWEVHFLAGPHAGKRLDAPLWLAAGLRVGDLLGISPNVSVDRDTWRIRFGAYDDAVKAEIAVLDAFRLKGLF